MIEIETRLKNIDKKIIIEKLKKLSAKKVFSEREYKRNTFICDSYNEPEWLRLRTDGIKTTLCYKNKESLTIDGMHEIEIVVDDFNKTKQLLLKSGFTEQTYAENKRERWVLGDVEIDIDTWPKLKPFVEIEGKNKKDVIRVVNLLGYKEKDMLFGNVREIYQQELGIDITKLKRLVF